MCGKDSTVPLFPRDIVIRKNCVTAGNTRQARNTGVELAGQANVASLTNAFGGQMKVLLWIVAIIFLIGLLVVFGFFSLIF